MYNVQYIHTNCTCECKHRFEEDHGYLAAVELEADLAFSLLIALFLSVW